MADRPPHLGDKPRQLSREVGMSGSSLGKIQRLLTKKAAVSPTLML
jgi:hypothetical protein